MSDYYYHMGNKIILRDFANGSFVGIATHSGEFYTHAEPAVPDDHAHATRCNMYRNKLLVIVGSLEKAVIQHGMSHNLAGSPTPYFSADRAIITDQGKNYAVGAKGGKLNFVAEGTRITTIESLKSALDILLASR